MLLAYLTWKFRMALTFNQVSVRFDGEYPASTSKHLTIIPSHEETNAFSRKEFIFANVASLAKQASSASTYKQKDHKKDVTFP